MVNWLLFAAAIIFIIPIILRLLMMRTGRRMRTTHVQLGTPDLAPELEGTRIVLLSDLHVGRLHVPEERLVAAVEGARPDLLFLGGDYVARLTSHEDALRLVARLSEGQPTFGVMGNADHHQWLDRRELRAILRAGGGDLLINEAGRTHIGDAVVEVLGVDDPVRGSADVNATLAQASSDADLRIGLCHSPAQWRQLRRLEAHITLVGHTHGGQIRVPGLEAHVTHLTYPRELAAGLFRYSGGDTPPTRLADHWEVMNCREPLRASTADGPLMYVTRGVGMGSLPVRLMCPPEIVIIELVRQESDGGDCDND